MQIDIRIIAKTVIKAERVIEAKVLKIIKVSIGNGNPLFLIGGGSWVAPVSLLFSSQ